MDQMARSGVIKPGSGAQSISAQQMARMQQSKNMAAKKAQEMERFRGGARPVPRPDTHVPVSRVRAPDGPQVNKDEGYRDDIRDALRLPLTPAGNSRPVRAPGGPK
jgi:hypothetical protein